MGGDLWLILKPGNSLVLLAVLGLALAWAGWRRRGLTLASAGVAGFLLWGVSPIGHWLMTPLENRYPQPDLPAEIAGIIVLGGSVSPTLTEDRGQPALNGRVERLTEAIAIGRRYPAAPIAFSGGAWRGTGMTEAAVARRVLTDLGAPNPFIAETDAANTHDNARYLARILPRDRAGPWVLVTSAYHMPRAMGLFERTDLAVLPYPVDYKTETDTSGWWVEIAEGAAGADFAAREWVALIVYYWRGRIASPFPGPGAG